MRDLGGESGAKEISFCIVTPFFIVSRKTRYLRCSNFGSGNKINFISKFKEKFSDEFVGSN
jgi:hypothetical protein